MKKIFMCVLLALSAFPAISAEPEAAPVDERKTLMAPGGRFVFGQVSDSRRDLFMLDTETGRLWQIAARKRAKQDATGASEEKYSVLEPVPYVDANGKLDLSSQSRRPVDGPRDHQ